MKRATNPDHESEIEQGEWTGKASQNGTGHPISLRHSQKQYQRGEPHIRIAPQH